MENLKNKVQQMLDKKNDELKKMQAELADMKGQLADCEKSRKALEQDTAKYGRSHRDMQSSLAEMKSSCDQLNKNYQQLKERSTEKMRELLDQLEAMQRDLNARETRLAEVEKTLALREARLQEVEGLLAARDSAMQALRKRIEDALLGFQKDGLTVEVIDGKVYVSLSNKLLFASGSTQIDKNGKNALTELARVLKDQADLTIMVEGHTDDVKVTNLGQIKDNWDLSVMRSTEVVRILVENGVQPTRIVPSGRGEFIPKVAGATTEARASNRRTEIILSPKLDELFQLINDSRK
jgi:chemotaxis protein MotB